MMLFPGESDAIALDPDGVVLLEDDDGAGMLNARITYKAARAGKHRIIASQFTSALGAFTLTVREVEQDVPIEPRDSTKSGQESLKKPGDFKTRPSGLKYVELRFGTGKPAGIGDRFTMSLSMRLKDGKKIAIGLDSKAMEWTLGKNMMIKGLEEGIVGMKEGGKRMLFVPPQLGYGKTGYGAIPPNAELHIEVELLTLKTQ